MWCGMYKPFPYTYTHAHAHAPPHASTQVARTCRAVQPPDRAYATVSEGGFTLERDLKSHVD